MPQVIFSHPRGTPGSLVVHTGADQISWGYGLNTQTFPTYGGEVVQILSAYIDDLNIQGTARSYASMESIYRWFLQFFQVASQPGRFDETPMDFVYPERGWHMKIVPKVLPGFRLATDVVAPAWQIQCQVVEQDARLAELTKQFVLAEGFDEFRRLNAGIGFDDNNPFSRFDVDKTKDKKKKGKNQKDFQSTTTKEALDKVGDWFGKLIPAYMKGDFDSTINDTYGSGPDKNNGKKGDKPKPRTQKQVPKSKRKKHTTAH